MDKPVIRGICAELLESLMDLVEIVEDEHYRCDFDSDSECFRFLLEADAWQIKGKHGAMRQARQAIAMAKGE
jgi:hypothetical protein